VDVSSGPANAAAAVENVLARTDTELKGVKEEEWMGMGELTDK
jgi:hypothetical protein